MWNKVRQIKKRKKQTSTSHSNPEHTNTHRINQLCRFRKKPQNLLKHIANDMRDGPGGVHHNRLWSQRALDFLHYVGNVIILNRKITRLLERGKKTSKNETLKRKKLTIFVVYRYTCVVMISIRL